MMQPPLVNVTPRVNLFAWAKNSFMPQKMDPDSCSLLFQKVMKNLETQHFSPEQYTSIMAKCKDYFLLTLENQDSSTSVDKEDDKLFYFHSEVVAKIEKLKQHKLMMQSVSKVMEQEALLEKSMLASKESELFYDFMKGDDIYIFEKEAGSEIFQIREVTKADSDFLHIKTLKLSGDDLIALSLSTLSDHTDMLTEKTVGEFSFHFESE